MNLKLSSVHSDGEDPLEIQVRNEAKVSLGTLKEVVNIVRVANMNEL